MQLAVGTMSLRLFTLVRRIFSQAIRNFSRQPVGETMANNDSLSEERLRASQMNELVISENSTLPPQERHRILLEVHGFHPNTSELDESMISSLLDRIRRQASMVRNRKAYNKALFLNPGYADSAPFLMMFLLAENCNPTKAAQRMVLHFESKLTLFGMDKLARKITYDDLSDDDTQALATGAIQVLPEKDRSGRIIVYETARSLRYKTIQNQVCIDESNMIWQRDGSDAT